MRFIFGHIQLVERFIRNGKRLLIKNTVNGVIKFISIHKS